MRCRRPSCFSSSGRRPTCSKPISPGSSPRFAMPWGIRPIVPATCVPCIASATGSSAALKAARHRWGSGSSPRSEYWLIWETGQVALIEGHNVLGRAPDAEVWLDAPGVSRHHARITLAGTEATVEDARKQERDVRRRRTRRRRRTGSPTETRFVWVPWSSPSAYLAGSHHGHDPPALGRNAAWIRRFKGPRILPHNPHRISIASRRPRRRRLAIVRE